MRITLIISLILAALWPSRLDAAPGLSVQFLQGDRRDTMVLPFPALHVPQGATPTTILSPGPFTAVFSGWISVDLRAQYTFTAELDGKLELLLNGKEILNVDANAGPPHTSKPVRLNRGTNSLIARFSAPLNRPATLRILWSSKNNAVPVPIPASALSHDPSDPLTQSLDRHNGAFLVEQFRCTKCHLPGASDSPVVPDAPALEGIGSRLSFGWLARWIQDPAAHRPARMPRLFHGPDAARQSGAIAAFLWLSKGNAPTPFGSTQPPEALRSHGATLFNDLHCGACHTLPNEPASAEKLSLRHLAQKFVPAALPEFLQNPHARYPSNPMPNFHLSPDEAAALAAFLLQDAPPAEPAVFQYDLASVGKSLLQSTGCLNCHSYNIENRFSAPTLNEIRRAPPDSGCLNPSSEKAPHFAFTAAEKKDIAAFLHSDFPLRSAPLENTARLIDHLRCANCHEDSGLATPLSLGGKLNPEWAARFIAGDIPHKPRPWLKARMPAFPAYATHLASGLAALHGHPPVTAPESPIDTNLVSLGAKLVSSAGGFSCVACHAVGTSSNAQIVESPGINLTFSGERLLPSYFHRWLMNPIAIDPATKMPAYFDAEARSQLTEFFDGDAHQQINAMWHYIRLGDKMPPPPIL